MRRGMVNTSHDLIEIDYLTGGVAIAPKGLIGDPIIF
jgi:hypothetical protein